jgi:hypothetical protein
MHTLDFRLSMVFIDLLSSEKEGYNNGADVKNAEGARRLLRTHKAFFTL